MAKKPSVIAETRTPEEVEAAKAKAAEEKAAWEEKARIENAAHEKFKADLNNRIVAVNAKLKDAWTQKSCLYEVTAVVTEPKDPHALAKTLSTRFPNIRFSVVYNKGRESVFAIPFLVQVEPSSYDKDVTKVEEALISGAVWPSFGKIQAYAEGFNEGMKAHIAGHESRRSPLYKHGPGLFPYPFGPYWG